MPLPNILEFIGTNITQRKFQEAQEKLLNYLGIEVPTKTELNSAISNVNDAITPKADKIYVDNALAAVAGGHKAYTTLALAQAAQASLPANTIVEVTNDPTDSNNGTYQWNGTTLTKSLYDPLTQAKADATTKANAAEENAKSYTNTKLEVTLQSTDTSVSNDDVNVAMTDSRGVRTWLEATDSGDLTEFAKKKILDGTNSIAPVKSKYAETASVVFVDELGRVLATFGDDEDKSSTAQTQVDLSTWAFFGSSSMMYLQDDVFNLLQSNFGKVKVAKYYGTSASRMQHTLANIGVNTASLTFMGGAIDNTARAVTSTGFDFGIPTIHTVRGSLENGVTGVYKDATFTADNQSLSVSTTTPIKFISDGSRHRNAVALVNIGKNNVAAVGADVEILAGTRAAVDYLDEKNDRHTIILGHFVNTDQTATGKANIISLNSSLRSIYFDRFIDVQAYLMGEQVWVDVGLTKTQADIDAIAAGVLPPSLGRDAAHLSEAVDTKLAEKVLNLVISKGWYA